MKCLSSDSKQELLFNESVTYIYKSVSPNGLFFLRLQLKTQAGNLEIDTSLRILIICLFILIGDYCDRQ